MKTVIFLDIDGVIVSRRTHFAYGDSSLMRHADPVACAMLKRVLDICDGKIVLMSAWCNKEFQKIKSLFEGTAINPETDFHENWNGYSWKENVDFCRGDVVDRWLELHPQYDSYAVIDDEPCDYWIDQKVITVRDRDEGFGLRDFKELLKVLEIDSVKFLQSNYSLEQPSYGPKLYGSEF